MTSDGGTAMLLPGDYAPHFRQDSSNNPDHSFDVAAGRYIVLSFIGSSRLPYSAGLLAEVARRRGRFSVGHAMFFAVTIDPPDHSQLKQQWAGMVYFRDICQYLNQL